MNADISEQETVTLNLNYKEETGVDSAYVTFSTEAGKTEEFEFQKGNDEEYVNEGTLQLTSAIQREQGEEYKLQSVDLRDREGNYNGYYKENEQSDYLTNNKGDQIPIISYKVKSEEEQTAPNYLLVQGIKFADGADKDNVTAGQTTLDAVATVHNNTGETGELHFSVEINRFLDKVTIVWTDISVYYEDSKGIHQIQYSNNGQGLASGRYYKTGAFEGGFVDFEGFEYTGTVDFTVTTSDTPDTEAPYVEKIQVLTSPIEAPGTIELGVWLNEGNAKTTQMLIDLVDKKRPENRLSFSTGTNAERKAEFYYSENQGCYILNLPLDDMILASEYEVVYFQLNDEALQRRWY